MNTEVLETTATPPDAGAGTDTPGDGPGWLVTRLAELPPATLVDEAALAAIFGCHQMSIKRAVTRGELPAPVRMFGRPTWTAGAVLRHADARLEAAEREAERERQRIARLGS
jgi:signal transduction histidine kinase